MLTQNSDGTQELQFHLRYYIDNNKKIKWLVWGGDNEGQKISSDIMSVIEYVYLNPLRDAVASLKPIRWNRLGELFATIAVDSKGKKIDDEKRDELAANIANAIKGNDEWNNLIEAGKKKINEHLENTLIKEDMQAIELDFLPF